MISFALAFALQVSSPTAAYAAEARESARINFTAGVCSAFGYKADTAALERIREDTERRGRAAGLSEASMDALDRAAIADVEAASPTSALVPEGASLAEVLDDFRAIRGRITIDCDRLAESHPGLIVADPTTLSPALAFLGLQTDHPLTGEIFYYVRAASSCPAGRTRLQDSVAFEALAAPLQRAVPQIEVMIRHELEKVVREGHASASSLSEAGCRRVMIDATKTLKAAWAASPLTHGEPVPVD